jgi:hypothetical protein
MTVVAEGDGAALYDGERRVATARPAEVTVSARQAPTFDEAVAASHRTFPPAAHKLPMCFVCGPDRRAGDGLRIHCGPLDEDDRDWRGTVAAAWIPGPDMAAPGGLTAREFVWAALDCPTAYAFGSAAGFPAILLGRQAVRIERQPASGERCVVTAWRTGQEGRKFHSEGALFGEDGSTIAFCKATWIEVDLAAQLAATQQGRG